MDITIKSSLGIISFLFILVPMTVQAEFMEKIKVERATYQAMFRQKGN